MTFMAGRTILITGCSSGIGLDAAHALKARGWRVFATCRAQADCDRLGAQGLESFSLDYADDAQVEAAAREALRRCDGRLDALFNNGAYAIPGFLEDLPTEALRTIFQANLIGWHTLTRALIPAMRAHAERGGAGRIVMCSSVLGFAPVRWRGAYVASKHALEGYCDSLRLEMRDQPLHVSVIQPGPIATRFNDNAMAQYARWIDAPASPRAGELSAIEARYRADRRPSLFTLPPSAVSRRVIHAVESARPRSNYRVTTPTHVVEALRRLAPRAVLDWLMARQ
jgi:NAD(P)-dependent dehydrogenase (short-subunit alcohol dehydrogenase family)